MVIIWVMKIFFVYFFCVFLLLLNIFCFCYVHTISALYCAHLFKKCSLGISNFLEEISSLVFSSISLHRSLRKALSLLVILWNSAVRWVYVSFSPFPLLLIFSQLFVMPPQATILPFYISFLGYGFYHHLLYKVTTSVHSSSGTMSIRSNPLNLFVTSTVWFNYLIN